MPSKKPTPTLTITIPSNEEEIRSLSSPESMSPLPSSAQDSGGSSPQRPKTRQDILSSREFKRQVGKIVLRSKLKRRVNSDKIATLFYNAKKNTFLLAIS